MFFPGNKGVWLLVLRQPSSSRVWRFVRVPSHYLLLVVSFHIFGLLYFILLLLVLYFVFFPQVRSSLLAVIFSYTTALNKNGFTHYCNGEASLISGNFDFQIWNLYNAFKVSFSYDECLYRWNLPQVLLIYNNYFSYAL